MPSTTVTRRPENGDGFRYNATATNHQGRGPPARPPQQQHPPEQHPPRPGGMNGGGAAAEATDAGGGERLPLPRHQDNSSNTNSATTTTTTPPTSLFERLVTEEVQELRAYVRMVEHQNRRLMELERVHGDLETRLEYESKQRQQLELTLEAREREWAERYQHLEMDRDQQKALVEAETIKNSKLIDQVYRKDQDIHRMLQRKVRWVLKVLVVFSFSGPFCVLGARSSLVYFGGGIFFFHLRTVR